MKHTKKFINTVILDWEFATNVAVGTFCDKYFDGSDYCWVANIIGGVFSVGDTFLSLSDAIHALKLKPTPKKLHAYYDYREELMCNDHGASPITLDYFLKRKQ